MMRLTRYIPGFAAIAAATLFSISALAGFYVSGTDLKEGNGSKFIMRGVNHPHAWFKDRTPQALKDIAGRGSNAVRVVLGNGVRWPRSTTSEVRDVISKAKAAGLISVLEVHDTTGYGEQPGAATLATAANYWVSVKGALIGQEDYVIINVGNEPFGNNNVSANQWVDQHKSAIQTMRNAGLKHTIMVDAPNWGQDWSGIMRDNASRVLSGDPARNVIFSVHMYEVYGSYSPIESYLSTFHSRKLVLVVGEFGHWHNGSDVDEGTIMSRTRYYGDGYLGWSWSGNSGSASNLDLVYDFNNAQLTNWGSTLFYGNDGIAATSVKASIFGGGNSCGFNSNLGYPICCHASPDPDHDGWGWENNKSCTLCGKTASNGYPYCCQGKATDPDGDGWGWENNRSCVVG